MAELKGIMVALITPFTDDQSAIDESRLQAHIERLIQAGVHGLVPGGSTGEFTVMTTAKRKQLTELCIKFAAGRVPVVVGTGSLSTAEAVELSVHAGQCGAAAVMVVPPFYDPVNLEQLHEMLAEIHMHWVNMSFDQNHHRPPTSSPEKSLCTYYYKNWNKVQYIPRPGSLDRLQWHLSK